MFGAFVLTLFYKCMSNLAWDWEKLRPPSFLFLTTHIVRVDTTTHRTISVEHAFFFLKSTCPVIFYCKIRTEISTNLTVHGTRTCVFRGKIYFLHDKTVFCSGSLNQTKVFFNVMCRTCVAVLLHTSLFNINIISNKEGWKQGH